MFPEFKVCYTTSSTITKSHFLGTVGVLNEVCIPYYSLQLINHSSEYLIPYIICLQFVQLVLLGTMTSIYSRCSFLSPANETSESEWNFKQQNKTL